MSAQEKIAREKKFYLMLPLIVLPFLTMFFWALGGGSGASGEEHTNFLSSLNTSLPTSQSEDSPRDKLSYYELAERDSARMLELIKRDSNYRFDELDSPYYEHDLRGASRYSNPMAERIYKGLDDLEREMQRGQQWSDYDTYSNAGRYKGSSRSYSPPENDYYDYNMNTTVPHATSSDPEIDQLNLMLDKIMEIQNPELVNERLRESSAKRRGEVFHVSKDQRDQNISTLDREQPADVGSGFFSLDGGGFSQSVQNTIQAVIHEDQTVVNGSTIKLRLVNDVYINGTLIPKDNFLFGVAQLTGERLGIKIESIRYRQSLFPVELLVYDLDGLDGIYIPGSITRDAVKESADRPLQSINLSSLDQSWSTQAAGAGVEVAKGLFSKKAKLIKVKIKAGYQVLLKDEKQKKNSGQ
ncbi:MAG: conjugative transposon protein TraM [Cyclobacteriaceae bacterium]|nr:conjugative transposon protein TraM [Cyclobacteriaceae bacterium]